MLCCVMVLSLFPAIELPVAAKDYDFEVYAGDILKIGDIVDAVDKKSGKHNCYYDICNVTDYSYTLDDDEISVEFIDVNNDGEYDRNDKIKFRNIGRITLLENRIAYDERDANDGSSQRNYYHSRRITILVTVSPDKYPDDAMVAYVGESLTVSEIRDLADHRCDCDYDSCWNVDYDIRNKYSASMKEGGNIVYFMNPGLVYLID